MTLPLATHWVRVERSPNADEAGEDIDPWDPEPPPDQAPNAVVARKVRAVIGKPSGSSTSDGGQRTEIRKEMRADPILGLKRYDLIIETTEDDQPTGPRWKLEWFDHALPSGDVASLAFTAGGLCAVQGEASPI